MITLAQALATAESIRRRPGSGGRVRVDWDRVIRLWFVHGNQHTVAREVGILQSQVSKILRAVGIRVGRGGRQPVHRLPMEEVARRYQAGESTIDLGTAYQVKPEVIRRRLIRHGVVMRPQGPPRGPKNPQWKGAAPQVREFHKLARRVAEFCLNEKLPTGSSVHHMDEDERNNDPSNLWVFPSQSAHCRYHQRLLATRGTAGSEVANQLALENGGQPLPLPADPTPLSLGTSRQFPYDTRVRVENVLRESGILPGKLVRPRERCQ